MANDVTFRRINGRIIPIRKSKGAKSGTKAGTDRKRIAQGAALGAAGVATAAGAGVVEAKLVFKAARAENLARKAMATTRGAVREAVKHGPLFQQAANKAHAKAGMDALKTMVESRKIFAASETVQKWGSGTGSALIGAGVFTALGSTRFKEDTGTRASIAAGAGIAAQFVVRTSFLKGLKHPILKAGAMAAKSLIIRGKK